MGLRFEKKIGIQFGVASFLIVLVGALAYSSLSVDTMKARRIEHALATLRALDHVMSRAQDPETGQRGYLLTGRLSDREPFDRAVDDLDRSLDAVGAHLRDDPGGLARLGVLRVAIGRKVAELRDTIELRRGGLNAALPTVLTDRGERHMDEVRGQIGRMKREQSEALGPISGQVGDGARLAVIVSDIGVVLTLTMIGFAFRLIVGELSARRRAEAELSGMAAIIASTGDAVIGETTAGVITSWNAAAERLFGYPASEAVGRDAGLLAPPDHDDGTARLIERAAAGAHPGRIETTRRRKDGTAIDVELRVSPIRGADGAIVGASTIARDVTTRKRAEGLLREKTEDLEAARARLTATAGFAAALNQPGMLETYRETLGCLARVARSPLAVLYDVIDGEAPRARCAVGPDLLPLESAEFRGDGLAASVARAGEARELFGPLHDPAMRTRCGLGEVALHSVLGWPVSFRGRALGVLVTAHAAPLDPVSRSFLTTALEQLAVRMDGYQVEEQRLRLVADLQGQSRAPEKSRLEAERANSAKSEFLAAMSHELRAPMNSIIGFTARLLRKLGPTLGERELDALKTVDRNAKHLLGLINDILDLSKIEAVKMDFNPETFDLAALARDAAGQSGALFDGKPIELVVDLPAAAVDVVADPKLIKQVVLNLLSNAARFTDRGTVTVTAGAFRVGTVRLTVRDTGLGIKAADRARLFQLFSQLDGSPSRKTGGTGLGLALSERMVRPQGGRIDVTSEPGRRSEFAIVLPRRAATGPTAPEPSDGPPPPPAAATPAETHAAPRGVTILCVDDEPDALKYLQLTFEDAGYSVLTAASHDDAVEGPRGHRPDLVCLDPSMPGKDGFEVVRTPRADPARAEVPILIVSATPEESRALRAGDRRYLAKPTVAGARVEAVHELLGAGAGDVLVVEDEPDALRLAADALAERGLHVRTDGNGREALRRLAEAPPAAIVLDLMMPVMDGLTFLGHLGRDPVWRQTPVVVMTARTLNAAEADDLGRGRAAVLAKGAGDTGQLVDAVLHALGPRHAAPSPAPEVALV